MKKLLVGISAVAMIAAASSVEAGKKDGTLNVGLLDSYSHINPTISPGGEMQVMARAVLDTLMNFNKNTGKFEPSLGLSYKRLNPTTWQYKLRQDVKWHDGHPFTAVDVAYSINWAIDKKNKFPSKLPRFGWAKGAEVIDKYTVNIMTKYKQKGEFGKKMIGTGPYRVVQVDKNKGVILARHKGFNLQNAVTPTPTLERAVFKSIPDSQAQVAQLLTGGLDVTRVFTKDLADK